jgi:hypothetical protein
MPDHAPQYPAESIDQVPFTEYDTFEAGLKTLTGTDYDNAEEHPGTLLHQIADNDTTIYAWRSLTGVPCLAWESPRGWAATIVHSTDGWYTQMWFTRPDTLGAALLDASEPTNLLDLIATACAQATTSPYATPASEVLGYRANNRALAWGLRLLLDPEDRASADLIAANYDCNIDNQGTIDPPHDGNIQAPHRDDLLVTRFLD